MRILILICLIVLFSMMISTIVATDNGMVSVFYKEREPSLKVLERVREMLEDFSEAYRIKYYLIDDAENQEVTEQLGLPSTHFPFAVVINGKYTANLDGRTVSFVHFPEFMHGIGRHEGNWSLEDLKAALSDTTLLADENILPELDREAETTECED